MSTHLRIYTYTHIRAYTRIYTYIHTYTHVYTHIYTYKLNFFLFTRWIDCSLGGEALYLYIHTYLNILGVPICLNTLFYYVHACKNDTTNRERCFAHVRRSFLNPLSHRFIQPQCTLLSRQRKKALRAILWVVFFHRHSDSFQTHRCHFFLGQDKSKDTVVYS
jgi:hypothetical protein